MTVIVESYPALNALLGGYFHQDYDLFGETIEEVALCYKRVTAPEDIAQACREMDRFVAEFGPGAATAFAENWRSFDPAGGGYTIPAFFEELKRVLIG
ncbi:contact-dependent growth inhibition system immunity protein [Achromobacter sp.]|uniref:contact-dependent growth inhibition system immunity protein n=1 Tax=Achromobacter sp. TaxID=134375 RepID=UPI0028A5ACB4|nr:contact-dependent growth inhibition system immunity protein [Achromobacter sp.]